MAFINDGSLDAGLTDIRNNTEVLYICSQEPVSVVEASTTYNLGTKTYPIIDPPSDRLGGGREIIVNHITDGTTNVTGQATHWALVRLTTSSRLLVTGELTPPLDVTMGIVFTLTSFPIGWPDAISE